jgi:hypothetical protein
MSIRYLALCSLIFLPAVAHSQSYLAQPANPAGLTEPASPGVGQSFTTMDGPGMVTGQVGNMATTTLPGVAGQGLLMNNGNGTSTLIVPGAMSQVITTPRR